MHGKRGQFYLIAAIIIIALVIGFVTITNTSRKQEITEIEKAGEELEVESRAVLDYASYNRLDSATTEDLLLSFTENYSLYAEAENIYFLFGDETRVVVAAYQKNTDGRIYVDVSGSDQEIVIEKQTYVSQGYDNPTINPVALITNEIRHDFELRQGKNFYFIASKGTEEAEYIFTGSAVKEVKDE